MTPGPGGSSEDTDNFALKLPAEIWYLIAKHLSEADEACLALTCKQFQQYFHPIWSTIQCREKLDFLLHLDKHFPNHRLCFTCAKYHARPKQHSYSLKLAFGTDECNVKNCCPTFPLSARGVRADGHSRCVCGPTMVGEHESRVLGDIGWPVLQLVSRAARYGSSYGYPLDIFEKDINPALRSGHWKTQTSAVIDRTRTRTKTKPHILLRIQCTTRLEQLEPYLDYRKCSRTFLEEIPHCAHTAVKTHDGQVRLTLAGRVQKVLHQATREDLFQGARYTEAAYACDTCPSEWAISAFRTGNTRFMQITRWSDLGDGIDCQRSPEWLALTSLWGEASWVQSPLPLSKRFDAASRAMRLELVKNSGQSALRGYSTRAADGLRRMSNRWKERIHREGPG